ncbi:MAG TPA: M14 family zinc carboxypeptidase [Ignavibacteriales bacterium]|nr:M14 family zinc carboxypeptidase [Ignavibacteriales bacterium]
MKKKYIFIIFFNCISIIYSQISYNCNFENGNVKYVDIAKIAKTKRSKKIDFYRLNIYSVTDPKNPVDSSLKPSSRWFYFKLFDVKNKNLIFNFINSDPYLPFYSYDNINFQRIINHKKYGFYLKPEKDTVYLSYFIPYTHKNLHLGEKSWRKSQYFQIDTIGYSTDSLPLKLYTVTNNTLSNLNKKVVWIHSRIHTSEAPSSFIVHFLLKNLLFDKSFSELLNNVVFYIVPFTNPDGVKYGLSRSNIQGINMEINWNRPDSLTANEIKILKKKILEIDSIKKIDILLNSHSQIENCLTYWIHSLKSTSRKYFNKQMLFAFLTTNKKYFSHHDFKYSDINPKYVEGQFWLKNLDSTIALTFETPYGYYRNNPKSELVSLKNLNKISKNLLNSINDYLMINNSYRLVLDNDKNNVFNDSLNYYFNNDYKILNKNNKIEYSLKTKLVGKYQIYKWEKVGDNYKWRYLKTIYLKPKLNKIVFKENKNNQIWDAILLIKN